MEFSFLTFNTEANEKTFNQHMNKFAPTPIYLNNKSLH
jgi:hypothetical protein